MSTSLVASGAAKPSTLSLCTAEELDSQCIMKNGICYVKMNHLIKCHDDHISVLEWTIDKLNKPTDRLMLELQLEEWEVPDGSIWMILICETLPFALALSSCSGLVLHREGVCYPVDCPRL